MQPLVPHRRRLWLYLCAALTVCFLVLPVLIVVPMSFSASRFLDFPPAQWSLRWYERFFSAPEWYGALLSSLKIAIATTIVATPLGVAAAYSLYSAPGRIFRLMHGALLLPMMVPHIILAIGIFYVFVQLELLGSFVGIVFAHTMLALPFVVISVMAGLKAFDHSQELVARSLGCSRLSAFLKITLPQIKPSVLSGALFAFVTSLDEVVVSLFISAGDNVTITKVMFGSLRDEIDPTIATVSALLIAGSFVIVGMSSVWLAASARTGKG